MPSFRDLLVRFDRSSSLLQAPLLLVCRLYWGLAFAQTGWGKLMNLERTAAFFGELGLPLPTVNAFAAGTVEGLGGVLLALGLLSRPAAAALAFTMGVAYATADREALLGLWSNPEAFTGAAPFPFLCASLVVLAFGPGAWSLDARRHRPATAA